MYDYFIAAWRPNNVIQQWPMKYQVIETKLLTNSYNYSENNIV